MPSRAGLLAALFATVALSGCGHPATAPVKGRVTCDGTPVAEVTVTFNPLPRSEGDREPGKPATGFTDADGVFILSTFKNYDGALIGKHKVTLTPSNPTSCGRHREVELEVKPGDNDFTIELNP